MVKTKAKDWHADKLCALACCECRTDVKELRPSANMDKATRCSSQDIFGSRSA